MMQATHRYQVQDCLAYLTLKFQAKINLSVTLPAVKQHIYHVVATIEALWPGLGENLNTLVALQNYAILKRAPVGAKNAA